MRRVALLLSCLSLLACAAPERVVTRAEVASPYGDPGPVTSARDDPAELLTAEEARSLFDADRRTFGDAHLEVILEVVELERDALPAFTRLRGTSLGAACVASLAALEPLGATAAEPLGRVLVGDAQRASLSAWTDHAYVAGFVYTAAGTVDPQIEVVRVGETWELCGATTAAGTLALAARRDRTELLGFPYAVVDDGERVLRVHAEVPRCSAQESSWERFCLRPDDVLVLLEPTADGAGWRVSFLRWRAIG
ncbi:MAG: hypothetical protein R3F62_25295 [Planctomycetota bacterium]